MIIWRNGKAGFVGGIKRLIKGVFDLRYSSTSAAPVAVVWTIQTDADTTWSNQANVSTTWYAQSDADTTWTEQ